MLQLAEHFGTATGAKVRRWCERWGWPLVWSTGGGHGSAMVAAADRVLDLSLVGRNTSRLNVTVSAAAVAAFDQEWTMAVAARTAAATNRVVLFAGSCNSTDLWQRWSGSALLGAEPKRGGASHASAGLLINRGAAASAARPDAVGRGSATGSPNSSNVAGCVGSPARGGGSGNGGGGHGPVGLHLGPPCFPGFEYFPANGSIFAGSRTCLDLWNGAGRGAMLRG